ncbi:MAG TPA: DUF6230 family protein [Nocardioidaceae bacterium]|nr:DUF6230 family protein [Nocardioidaceae bacterium]
MGQGRVRLGRFFAVIAPCVAACLGVVLAIMSGWISVAFASSYPLDLTSSQGRADRLSITLGTDREVTGMDGGDRARPVALLHVSKAELADLCLVPRLKLPVIGRMFSLRISSGRTVRMGSANLAAAQATVDGLEVPHTYVGASPEDSPARPGGFAMATGGERGSVRLDGLDTQVYGLTLEDGMSLRSIVLRPRFGDQHC